MTYQAIIERSPDGYWIYLTGDNAPAVYGSGQSIEEAIDNLYEGLDFALSELETEVERLNLAQSNILFSYSRAQAQSIAYA